MRASLTIIFLAGLLMFLAGCKPAEVKAPAPTPSPEKPVTSAATPRQQVTIIVPPPVTKPAYVTVEPFAGVTLDLPPDWLAIDSESTDPATPSTPIEALVGKSGFAGPRASWSFVPPNHTGAELNIALNPQPPTASRKNPTELPQEIIDTLAKSFSETLEPILEGRGYRLNHRASWEQMKSSGYPAVLWRDEAESPAGTLEAQVLLVQLENASLIATFLWSKTPDHSWEPVIERARTTLRATSSAGTLKP